MTSIDALAPWIGVVLTAIVGAATGVAVLRRVTPDVLSAVERSATADAVEAEEERSATADASEVDEPPEAETSSSVGRAAESYRKSQEETERSEQALETDHVVKPEGQTEPDEAKSGRSRRQLILIVGFIGLGNVLFFGAIVFISGEQVLVGAAVYFVGLALVLAGIRLIEQTRTDTETTEPAEGAGELSAAGPSHTDRTSVQAVTTATDMDGGVAMNAEIRSEFDEVDRTDETGKPSVMDTVDAVESPTAMHVTGNSAVARRNQIGAVEPNKGPVTMVTTGASAVEAGNGVDPVETVESPDPITTTETISVVRRESRLVPIKTPAVMVTDGTCAVEEATLIGPVEGTQDVDTDDRPDGDEGEAAIVCEYCGRDDFESVPQRNGHLRWCDEYDKDAAHTAESSAASQTRHDQSTTGSPDTDVVSDESADVDGGSEATGEMSATTAPSSETDDTDHDSTVTGHVNVDAEPEEDVVEPAAGTDDNEAAEEFDIVETYATVRRQLREELDIRDYRTSQEFYHVCRSRGLDEKRLTALERLTQAYERVQYSANPDLDVDEVRAAAACFETVEQ